MSVSGVPHNCLIVISTGGKAKLYRNDSVENGLKLSFERILEHNGFANESNIGPNNVSLASDEAACAKTLADDLNKGVASGDYDSIIIAAVPEVLDKIRPLLKRQVMQKLIFGLVRIGKNSSLADVENIIGNSHYF